MKAGQPSVEAKGGQHITVLISPDNLCSLLRRWQEVVIRQAENVTVAVPVGDVFRPVLVDWVHQTGHVAAVGGDHRNSPGSATRPPTIGEFVPGYEASAWFGVGAPRNTPARVVDKLNKEINAGLADPAMRSKLDNLGGGVFASTPAEFGRFIAEETEKWGKVVKFAVIKPE
jgi:Tripartite tricarboxylate transporter family receptor